MPSRLLGWRDLTEQLARDPEEGQGLVEYTLLIALIAFVAIASVSTLGEAIVTKLYTLGGSL